MSNTNISQILETLISTGAFVPKSEEHTIEFVAKLSASMSGVSAVTTAETTVSTEPRKPVRPLAELVSDDALICPICDKGDIQMMKKHLRQTHNMEPEDLYREFGWNSDQYPMVPVNYSRVKSMAAKVNNFGKGDTRSAGARAKIAEAKIAEEAPATPKKRGRKKKVVEEKAIEVIEAAMEDLGVTAKGNKKRGPVAPKYFNPENPEEKWTGRGRQPKWFEAALNAGTPKSEMAL